MIRAVGGRIERGSVHTMQCPHSTSFLLSLSPSTLSPRQSAIPSSQTMGVFNKNSTLLPASVLQYFMCLITKTITPNDENGKGVAR